MLASAKLVGFISTTDYGRARGFYEGKLGCEILSADPFAMVASLGGHQIRIVKMPDFKPVRNTVLGWDVTEIEAVVSWLKQQGVELEKYPFIENQESGIWAAPGGAKVAWFKDPDGNVLSVSQHV